MPQKRKRPHNRPKSKMIQNIFLRIPDNNELSKSLSGAYRSGDSGLLTFDPETDRQRLAYLHKKKLLPRVPRPIWVKNFFVKTDADSSFLLFSPLRAACVLHSLLFLTGVARNRVGKHSDFQTFLLISNPTKNAYSGPLLSAVDSSRGEKLIIDIYFRCGDLYRQSLHFGLLWSVTSMPRNLLFSPIQDGFVLPC